MPFSKLKSVLLKFAVFYPFRSYSLAAWNRLTDVFVKLQGEF